MIIQVAGLHDREEALACVAAGASHLGFPLGPGVRTPDASLDQVASICAALPSHIGRVLITYLEHAEDIAALAHAAGCNWVQLHGPVADDAIFKLAALAPKLTLVLTLAVPLGAAADDVVRSHLARASGLAPAISYFFTDTLDPATGHRGATGLVHDLSISARLAQELPRPLVVAGGLTPFNVASVVNLVRPAGVDAHSGLEDENGRKDPRKVADFAAWALKAHAAVEKTA